MFYRTPETFPLGLFILVLGISAKHYTPDSICLLRRRYLAFNFIDFDSLRRASRFLNRDEKNGSRIKQTQ